MIFKKRSICRNFIWVFICITTGITAQTKMHATYSVSGTVRDSATSNPIEMVIITVPEINYWTTSKVDGTFELQNVPDGSYSLSFHTLGYKDYLITGMLTKDMKGIEVLLQPFNLSLKEVVVTATESKFGTSSLVKSEAIQHIQPKSLTDVFQLLPGQITENPNLASPGQVRIRDVADNDNTAMGALVVVNEAPVSNDANMQVFSTSKSGSATATPGTVGGGTDLREISAENIESVEVIRGIPSSEYGNLTSGVVLVKTRMGETPYRVNLKTDPFSKIASIEKGFQLTNDRGILNAGLDYTRAYDDIRLKYRGYNRMTGSLRYSNTYLRSTAPLTLNVNFSLYNTLDREKDDPQLKTGEEIRSDKTGFRAGINAKWMLKRSWITNLEYAFSGDYAVVEDYEKNLLVISSGAVPYPVSYSDKEYKADYLPGVYYSEYTMNGKPYHAFAKLKGDWIKVWNGITNKVLAGAEWSVNGNRGEGLLYDISRPPSATLSNTRPRAYKDLPGLSVFSLFFEDKTVIPIQATRFTLQAGMRFTYISPGRLNALEPRLLGACEFLNRRNNRLFDRLAINLGYGIAAKMPALAYLNPDKAYFDEVSLNYLDKASSLAVVTTHVIEDTSNPALKPSYNYKKELGLDFKIGQVSGVVTAYYEKTNGCFGFASQPYFNTFRKFKVEGSGKEPVYENGEVYFYDNGVKTLASFTMDTTIRTYNRPVNDEVNIKRGVEYTLNLGKSQAINTSLILDGAWLYDERYNTLPTYVKNYTLYQGGAYPYIAVMPPGDKTIRQRFNTNVRTITHIPELRIIVSLTTQIIWVERTRYRWEDENGIPYVYYYKDGVRIDGSPSAYARMDAIRYVDPIAFLDKQGVVHSWKKEYSLNSQYSPMVETTGSDYYYVEERFPPVVQFNLRLTKEFARNLTVSFMANNFLKKDPYQKSRRTSLYVQRSSVTKLYFGAELSYKF